MDYEVKITGLDDLLEKFKTFPPAFSRRLFRGAMRTAATIFENEISMRAPRLEILPSHTNKVRVKKANERRRPGDLAMHIGMASRINSDLEGWVRVGPSKRTFWGMFLEFGTHKMKARPFIRPAFEAVKERVLGKFVEEGKRTLAGMGLPEGEIEKPYVSPNQTSEDLIDTAYRGVADAIGQMSSGLFQIVAGFFSD